MTQGCKHERMDKEDAAWGPVLIGERVRLEPIGPALARAILAGEPNPDLAWESGFPMPAIAKIAEIIAGAAVPLGPFLAYVIIRRADGLAIGDAGFHGPPNKAGEVEIGYALAPPARGAGFVHEALQLLIAWAWSNDSVRAITARVHEGNAPSERVLHRLGFTPEGKADLLLFALRERPRDGGSTSQ